MEVAALDGRWINQAREIYNRLTAPLPFSLPAGEEEFATALERDPTLAGQPFRLAAVEADRLRGFASGAVNLDSDSHRVARFGDGILHTLFAEDAAAADMLLRAALDRFSSAGAGRIVAFDAGEKENRLRFFNGGFAAFPEQLPGTLQALALAGFTLGARELHMTRELGAADIARVAKEEKESLRSSSASAVELRWQNPSPAILELEARTGDVFAGQCNAFVMSSLQSHPEAALRGYIDWLGVEPAHQRQGIGRRLLGTMLAEMERRGLRRVFLTTGSQNWRAQPLYLSFGFLVTGTSVTMIREASL